MFWQLWQSRPFRCMITKCHKMPPSQTKRKKNKQIIYTKISQSTRRIATGGSHCMYPSFDTNCFYDNCGSGRYMLIGFYDAAGPLFLHFASVMWSPVKSILCSQSMHVLFPVVQFYQYVLVPQQLMWLLLTSEQIWLLLLRLKLHFPEAVMSTLQHPAIYVNPNRYFGHKYIEIIKVPVIIKVSLYNIILLKK